MPLSFPLKEIGTRAELAQRLGVSIRAVDLLLSPLPTPCTTSGCPLPAFQNNSLKCFLCRQGWFPREFKPDGTRARNCRGYGLYGPQFLRADGKSNKQKWKTCCCTSPLCEKLGYSQEGMMRLPPNHRQCREALRVLGISSAETREKILANPRNYMVAPWHYHRDHRTRNEKGNWILRKLEKFQDSEGKIFDFAPPNGSVQSFIDSEIPQTCARGECDNALPAWFPRLTRLQEQARRFTADAKERGGTDFKHLPAVGLQSLPADGSVSLRPRRPEGSVATEVADGKGPAPITTSGEISSLGEDDEAIRPKGVSMHYEIAAASATRKRPPGDESSEDGPSSETLTNIDSFLQRRVAAAKKVKRESAFTDGGDKHTAVEAEGLGLRDPLGAPASPLPPSPKHPEPNVGAGRASAMLYTENHAPSERASGQGHRRTHDQRKRKVTGGFEPLNNGDPSHDAKCDGLFIVKRALDRFYQENKGAPNGRRVDITLSTMMSAAITAKYTILLSIDHQLGKLSYEDAGIRTNFEVDEEWLMDAAREFGWELIDTGKDAESTSSNGTGDPEKCNTLATRQDSQGQSSTYNAKQIGAPGETICRPSYPSRMKLFPTWEENFYQLVLYQSRNNGSSVISPEDYNNYRNLGNWVRDIRTLYNKRHIMGEGALSVKHLDQISALKQIGFVFEANISRNGPFAGAKNEKTWKEKYRELDEHLRKNNGEYPKCHSNLYQWIAYQRMAHREYQFHLERLAQKYPNHRPLLPEEMPRRRQEEPLENGMLYVITLERIDKLSQLDGFKWGQAAFQLQVPFERRLEQYEEFRREKGHGFVPRFYEENPGLGKWVQTIRKKHKKAAAERMERLEALGFEFSGGPPRRKAKSGVTRTWTRNEKRVD